MLTLTTHDRLSTSKLIRGWSRRTYAIYLLHPLCLYPVLDQLVPVIGRHLTLFLALLLLAGVAEAAHRWFEMPVDRWIRSQEKPRSRQREHARTS